MRRILTGALDKHKDTSILEWKNDRRLKILEQFLSTSDALFLDAGCATGDFLHHTKSRYNVYCFDFSVFAVDLDSKKNLGLSYNIFDTDVGLCALQPSQYNAICLWDVIEPLLEIDY